MRVHTIALLNRKEKRNKHIPGTHPSENARGRVSIELAGLSRGNNARFHRADASSSGRILRGRSKAKGNTRREADESIVGKKFPFSVASAFFFDIFWDIFTERRQKTHLHRTFVLDCSPLKGEEEEEKIYSKNDEQHGEYTNNSNEKDNNGSVPTSFNNGPGRERFYNTIKFDSSRDLQRATEMERMILEKYDEDSELVDLEREILTGDEDETREENGRCQIDVYERTRTYAVC